LGSKGEKKQRKKAGSSTVVWETKTLGRRFESVKIRTDRKSKWTFEEERS